ncbi:sigma 54-interacting transcriptional regulator [Myxococcota bacterium]|nr:sigma 54-interacting transcriptional regulator [Myxococcota bacterium]
MAGARTLPHRRSFEPVRGLSVEVVAGPDKGKRAVARSDSITIGSAPGNDLVLTDPTVSRYHVELERRSDQIFVQDHRSTNGTLAGAIALERAAIPAGTVLTVGRTQLRVDDGEVVAIDLLEDDRLGSLRGRSAVMRALMARIERAAATDAPVLLVGETGCGKELIARALHEEGPRAAEPFEIVDCGALMPTLVASELFGHEKGAFTGADRQHVGAFERAHGGTLFLDEIGELPAALQPALLGALERRTFRRVGGTKPIEVDVRVIAATHRDLRAEVNAGTFRQDLYFRLAVILLRVPPLRERPSDLPILIEHFLREAGYSGDTSAVIPDSVMQALAVHRWPGNVRELRNFVEHALAMGEAPPLEAVDVASAGSGGAGFPSEPLERLLERPYREARELVVQEFEGLYLGRLLERAGGNVARAARLSDMNRTYLTQMLKRHPSLRRRGDDE